MRSLQPGHRGRCSKKTTVRPAAEFGLSDRDRERRILTVLRKMGSRMMEDPDG